MIAVDSSLFNNIPNAEVCDATKLNSSHKTGSYQVIFAMHGIIIFWLLIFTVLLRNCFQMELFLCNYINAYAKNRA